MAKPSTKKRSTNTTRKSKSKKSLKSWFSGLSGAGKLLVVMGLFGVIGTATVLYTSAKPETGFFAQHLNTTLSLNAKVVQETARSSKRNAQVVEITNASSKTDSKAVLDRDIEPGEWNACVIGVAQLGSPKVKVVASAQSTTLGSAEFTVSNANEYGELACFKLNHTGVGSSGKRLRMTVNNLTQSTAFRLGSVVLEKVAAPPPTQPGQWQLTFSDEFNGTSIDTSKWNVFDINSQYYNETYSSKPVTCPKASNVRVSDGTLKMIARKSATDCATGAAGAVKGQPISGAQLNSKGPDGKPFKQAGGRWVGRFRQSHKGNNLWTGIWTAGKQYAVPASETTNGDDEMRKASEIGIMEYIGKTAEPNISRYKPALHYCYGGNCHANPANGSENYVYSPIDVTQWHEYAVENVTTNGETTISWFLDGKLTGKMDKTGVQTDIDGDGILTRVASNETWQSLIKNYNWPYIFASEPTELILNQWVGAPGVDVQTAVNGFNPGGNGEANIEFDYVRVYAKK